MFKKYQNNIFCVAQNCYQEQFSKTETKLILNFINENRPMKENEE